MLQVGSAVPDFRLSCVRADHAEPYAFQFSRDREGWLVLIFYPRDFSFVCPTELSAFSERVDDFTGLNCQLLGVSVDSVETHNEWLSLSTEQGGLAGLKFPLASDAEGRLAKQLGVWNESGQLPNRGLLVIDPQGKLQYSVVHNLHIGRSVEETLRVISGLQSGGLCPATWTGKDGTLDAEGLLAAGRVLGHYRLKEVLGQGSFGTVFAAWDLRLERDVALKVLRRSHHRARRALLDEARAAASIHHPYVCTIHSVEELDHLPVIVMRYVEGGSLTDRLRDRPFSAEESRTLIRRVAEGLAAAHERGIVHGDLKPANILIDELGNPCIVDFGLSSGRAVVMAGRGEIDADRLEVDETMLTVTGTWNVPHTDNADESSQRTWNEGGTVSWRGSTRSLVGTPAYMSPEQAAGEAPGPLSDIFSLGLVFAELLSGTRVLDERSVLEILRTLRSEDLPQRVATHLGDRFPKACLAMLHRDAADRPTARQIVAALG